MSKRQLDMPPRQRCPQGARVLMIEAQICGIGGDRFALEIDEPQFATPRAGKDLIAQGRNQGLSTAQGIDEAAAE